MSEKKFNQSSLRYNFFSKNQYKNYIYIYSRKQKHS